MWGTLSVASLMVILVVDVRCVDYFFGYFKLMNHAPENPYCEKEHECKIGSDTYLNTLCVYKRRPFRGDQLVKVEYRSADKPEITHDFQDKMATTEKKEAILKFLNQWRDNVAKGVVPDHPNAGNMRQLTWDPILEKMAVYWGQMGAIRTDKCRKVVGVFERPAQIVFNKTIWFDTNSSAQAFKDTDSIDAVKMLDERTKQFKGNKVKELIQLFKWQNDTHYDFWATALWANSFKVGCTDVLYRRLEWYQAIYEDKVLKVARFRKDVFDNFWIRAIFCNFGPGITASGPIYDNKPACGSCPSGTECRKDSVYPNLCALATDPKDHTLGGEESVDSSHRICPFPMINLAFVSLFIYQLTKSKLE